MNLKQYGDVWYVQSKLSLSIYLDKKGWGILRNNDVDHMLSTNAQVSMANERYSLAKTQSFSHKLNMDRHLKQLLNCACAIKAHSI